MKKNFKYIFFMSFLFLFSITGVKAEEIAAGCDMLGGAGSDTVEILSWIVKLIRIGVPILIIVLGMTDFLRILFSGEEKVFKDAFTKFTKRLLIGVIMIFIPYILYFLVTLSGVDKQYGIDNFFCGIIDAASGVTLSPGDISNAKTCREKGFYWFSDVGECINNIQNISQERCESNGYVWEEIQYSVGNSIGHCSRPSLSSIHDKESCEKIGYTWKYANEEYGGHCSK